MTESQANIVILELGVMALSSLLIIGGTVGSWIKLKRKAIDVVERLA
jgi:hypothetical protein